MTQHDLIGIWKNEFGSLMAITAVEADGGFRGLYSSTTGASGTYRVVGTSDPNPPEVTRTLAFAISWRSITGEYDPSWHYNSGFAGQLQLIDGQPRITTTYLLVENTAPADNWGATVVATATFRKLASFSSERDHVLPATVELGLSRRDDSTNGATPWVTEVELGTPGQRLSMMIDTGTENTWVTSSQCTTQACLAHRRFDPKQSSSYHVIDQEPKTRDFGPWGEMITVLGKDVISGIDNLSLKLKLELAVKYQGEQFTQLAADGGLAIPSIPVRGKDEPDELLPRLMKAGYLSSAIACFTFEANRRGRCTFGAFDLDGCDPGTLSFLGLRGLTGGLEYLWAVNLDEFACAGKQVATNIQFVLDTGSSWFKGGQSIIARLIAAVTDHGQRPTTLGDRAELAHYPDIALTLGGVEYTLTPEQYFLHVGDRWVLGIQYLEGLPDELLLVGTMFLETIAAGFFYSTNAADRFIVLARRRSE